MNYSKLFGVVFWAFTLIIFIAGLVQLIFFEETALTIIGDLGLIGIFFVSVFADMLVQPIGPEIPLIIGIMVPQINNYVAILTVIAGVILSFVASYYLGKKLGGPGIEAIIGKKKYKKILKKEKVGKWVVFLGAITPVPYIPYLAGMLNFSIKDSLLYVIIPRSVRIVIVFALTLSLREQFIKIFLLG